jgi:hypothetical protein
LSVIRKDWLVRRMEIKIILLSLDLMARKAKLTKQSCSTLVD